MQSLRDRFTEGVSFDEMVASAKSNAELFAAVRSRAEAPPAYTDRIAATGRSWHLLLLSEDWCGDSVNILPWVDALAASSPLVDLRIIGRDANLDLMDDGHLTNGTSRAIPLVLLLDESFTERSWWGPRPRELQAFVSTPKAQAMSKEERYKELRRLYARDRGRMIMEEITAMIEQVAQASASATASAAVQA